MADHYSLERWTDFVRGLLPADEAERLREHQGACAECRKVVNQFSRVVETAAWDRQEEVPEAVVQRAWRLFPNVAKAPMGSWRRLIAILEFDSLGATAPAGVRSSRGGARQLRYRVEGYEIDLQVDRGGPGLSMYAITGQFSRHLPAFRAWGGAEYRLLSGALEIVRGAANELGEFEVECTAHPDLVLQVGEPGERLVIELPLGSIVQSGTAEEI